jgi:hypothetical protein
MHDRRLPHSSPVLTRRSTRRGCRRASSAGVAQLAEHLFCKQVVGGSSPPASSNSFGVTSEGCPSGQREQAVNLPAHAYVGSNPTPSTCQDALGLQASHWRLARALGNRRRPVGCGSVALCAGRRSLIGGTPRRPRRFFAVGSVSFADRDLVFQDPRGPVGQRWRAGNTLNETGLSLETGLEAGRVAETFGMGAAFNEVRRFGVGGWSAGPLRSSRGSSSIGRASAFQAERRGFESLLPLHSLNGRVRCWAQVQHLNERIGWPT